MAVAGMPLGAPGMESPDGRRTAFDVIAFSENGRSVFARYAPG
ncbi:MAG: metal-binding protein [Caulobacterales bacterium]|nr:metal-binding protein [Caulobacterales bacterium]